MYTQFRSFYVKVTSFMITIIFAAARIVAIIEVCAQ